MGTTVKINGFDYVAIAAVDEVFQLKRAGIVLNIGLTSHNQSV